MSPCFEIPPRQTPASDVGSLEVLMKPSFQVGSSWEEKNVWRRHMAAARMTHLRSNLEAPCCLFFEHRELILHSSHQVAIYFSLLRARLSCLRRVSASAGMW